MKGARRSALRVAASAIVVAAVALIVGCASSQRSSLPPVEQPASNPPPHHVEGLCSLPDAPPADLAQTAGYKQFSVSVTDAAGKPVAGLKQQDFVVYEASRSFPVAYFRESKHDDPIAIALVVDTSGSMEPKLDVVTRSLSNLVENLNRCDEVTLLSFSNKTIVLMPLSTDHKLAEQKMSSFHAYGQTALYGTVGNALQMLHDADYPNRTIILITDGIDNTGDMRLKEVTAWIARDGVPIYAVGIGDPNAKDEPSINVGPFRIMNGDDRIDAASLNALSAAAGGQTFIVPAAGKDADQRFKDAVSTIADTIGQGYSIGAVLPADATTSNVKVAVANRPELVAHAHLIAAAPSAK